jgi:hypothetical protein
MSALEFISSIVKSLAWPATIITIAVLLKPEIVALLRRLRRAKVSSSEFDFVEGIQAVEKAAEEAAGEANLTAADRGERSDDRLVALADELPRGAIVAGWLSVEQEMRQFAKSVGAAVPAHATGTRLIAALRRTEEVTPAIIELLDRLRVIRNTATHDVDFEPTRDQALDYLDAARLTTSALKSAREARMKHEQGQAEE